MDQQDLGAHPVHQAIKDPSDPQEKRVLPVRLASKVLPGSKASWVLLVKKVQTAHLAPKALRDFQAYRDLQETSVKRETWDLWVHPAPKDHQDSKEKGVYVVTTAFPAE